MKTNFTIIPLIFFLIRAFTSLNHYTDISSVLISFFIGFLLLLLSFHMTIKEKKGLKILSSILLLFFFGVLLTTMTNFIQIHYFHTNNDFLIILALVFLSLLIGKNNIDTIVSMSSLLFIVFLLTFFLFVVGIIHELSFISISIQPSISMLSFGFLFITKYFQEKKIQVYKGYLLAFIITLLEVSLGYFSLGYLLSITYLFTNVSIFKYIPQLSFLGNFEVILSFVYLFQYTITLGLLIHLFKRKTIKEK